MIWHIYNVVLISAYHILDPSSHIRFLQVHHFDRYWSNAKMKDFEVSVNAPHVLQIVYIRVVILSLKGT